ncbi:MAG: hypothetical protein HY887_04905 [Deltaproteobacteria bacterium]|nr:hypothetical protein [Deltaproteobacteria bacterium]
MAEMTGIPGWFKEANRAPCSKGMGGNKLGFIEKSLKNIASFMKGLMDSEESANAHGVVQRLEPASRMAGFLAVMLGVSFATSGFFLVIASAFALVLSGFSNVRFSGLFKRTLPAVVFTSIIALPVFFSYGKAGNALISFSVAGFDISVTPSAVKTAVFFISRVFVMALLAALLMLTTRQSDFFSGLKRLKVPALFVTALFLTFRHIFILIKTAEDMLLARRSRTISSARLTDLQGWFESRVMLLLRKSLVTAEEVSMAMTARAFSGKVKPFGFKRLVGRDYLWIGASFFILFLSLGL